MSDNPPAFPFVLHDGGGESGMSLRDWFAGQALAGLLGGNTIRSFDMAGEVLGTDAQSAASATAFKMADAMLAERSKP